MAPLDDTSQHSDAADAESGAAPKKQVERDFGQYGAQLDVTKCMIGVRKSLGKGYLSQIREIRSLARGVGHLTPKDYFYYRLYDDRRYGMDEKRRFLSEGVHWPLTQKCCDVRWWAAADDKLLAHTILERAGATVPAVQAVFAANRRHHGPLRTCRSIPDLVDFFGAEARFPLFAKPVAGMGSLGAFLVHGFEPGLSALVLAGGETVTLEDFVHSIDEGDGYVFQDCLRPHPVLAELCGETVSTVRVIVIIENDRPEIIETVWKIPAGGNIADNFWRTGNMLGAVDIASGTVSRVVRGYGPDLEEPTHHPDTGKALTGSTLPHWDAVKYQCLDYAMVFNKLRYQSWDVAIGPDGPVMVEVNAGSAFNLSQLATGRGILTDRFRAFLQYCGHLDASGKAVAK